MPDYKRKKVNKTFHRPKKNVKNNDSDIIMSKEKNSKKALNSDIKVVQGNKLARKHRLNVTLTTVAVITVICILLSLILPGGLFENILNTTKTFGAGSYPADVVGSSVVDIASKDSYYYVLTDTNINAFSNNGKKIFSLAHGFSNPVLKTGSTRALVFDQGGKSVNIYNLGGLIDSLDFDFQIINADISRSGIFAVATHSDNYASTVNVYDKGLKNIYTWNSAKDIVSNVLLNNSGKKLAVACLNATAGKFVSKVSILNFESADALFTLDMNEQPVLALDNLGNGISVITAGEHRFVNWRNYKTNSVSQEGEINIFRKGENGSILVFNRANDRSDNTVVILSNRGEKTHEFKINDFISDIRYDNGRIYYVSDTNVSILNKKGALLRSGNCSYGCVCFGVIGAHSLAIVTDTEIQRADIEKGD